MSAKFKCSIIKETDAALLIRQEIENREPVETWIPRSQCDHISKGLMRGDGSRDATITASEWIIEKKGIIENA